jgi:hypothetical protein
MVAGNVLLGGFGCLMPQLDTGHKSGFQCFADIPNRQGVEI